MIEVPQCQIDNYYLFFQHPIFVSQYLVLFFIHYSHYRIAPWWAARTGVERGNYARRKSVRLRFLIYVYTHLVESSMFFTAACDVSKVNELVYTQFNGQTYPDKIKKKGELETPEEISLKWFNRFF